MVSDGIKIAPIKRSDSNIVRTKVLEKCDSECRYPIPNIYVDLHRLAMLNIHTQAWFVSNSRAWLHCHGLHLEGHRPFFIKRVFDKIIYAQKFHTQRCCYLSR